MRKLLLLTISLFMFQIAYAQVECETEDPEPFNIFDEDEVKRKSPFGLSNAEALLFLQEHNIEIPESYMNGLKKENPELFRKFKNQELSKLKEKEKIRNLGGNLRIAPNGIYYIEIRFWRHLNQFTGQQLYTNEDFESTTNIGINELNNAFANNNIPIRFFKSCGIFTFQTTQFDLTTETISKSHASNVINIFPNQPNGIDVYYFHGRILNSSNTPVNFASLPWQSRNNYIGATRNGLRTTTFQHEIGHGFGLRHTHDNARGLGSDNGNAANCYQESVSRSRTNGFGCFSTNNDLKCEINGDQFCDTQASYEALSDDVNSSGFYSGTGKDNWNDFWDPPVNNLMSYSNAPSRFQFSLMQRATMLSYGIPRSTGNLLTISGPNSVCTNQNAVFSVNNPSATSYNWIVPFGFIIISGQGTSSITVQNTSNSSGGVIEVRFGGCGNANASKVLTGPFSNFNIVGNSNVNPNYSIESYFISNDSDPTASYTWTPPLNTSLSGGNTGSSVTLIFNPTFTSGFLTVTRTTNCGSSNLTFFIQASGGGGPLDPVFLRTGPDEVIDEESELIIYPNPSYDGSFKITHRDQVINEINIMDLLGRRVRSYSTSHKTTETMVTGLSKGTYLVEFTDKNQMKLSHKIIIY